MRNANVFKKLHNLTDETKLMNIVQQTVDETRELIVENAPMRTGEYIASIQTEVHRTNTGVGGSVYTTMPKLRDWLENGTGIYRVDGSGRKTPWRYYDGYTGRFYTTKGIAPRPHWTPAIQIARIKLAHNLKKGLR